MNTGFWQWSVGGIGILLLLGVGGCVSSPPLKQDVSLRVGSIIPLSGTAAVWGEDMRGGMELAKEDLENQGISVTIVYEDSQARAADGVAAYTKLQTTQPVDAVVSAMSRVSVPLVPLADRDSIPLLMTLVSAHAVTKDHPFAFRFYTSAAQYVEGHALKTFKKSDYKRIGVLYLNDEYGVSVVNALKGFLETEDIELAVAESFAPNTTDFRTSLTKIKGADPDALVIVPAVPAEVIAIVKQFRELRLDIDLIETSVTLSSQDIREALSGQLEGVYTNAYPFTLGLRGSDFRKRYEEAFGREPLFSAAMSYDMIQMLARGSIIATEKHISLRDALHLLEPFETMNGMVRVSEEGEINPDIIPVEIKNGLLVPVE